MKIRIVTTLIIGLLAVSMLTGCGGDECDDCDVPGPGIWVIDIDPPSGSTIAANASITLTFDNAPADVKVNSPGTAVISGKTVTVSGPFIPGALLLIVTWEDGSTTLYYTVTTPDTDAPTVTSGVVKDGDKDVDPDAINSDGKIEITFSEEVTGNIALQTEAGDDVGWFGKVDGSMGTLELVKGREIGNKTTYVIVGKVSDAAGNAAEIKITFVTRTKE